MAGELVKLSDILVHTCTHTDTEGSEGAVSLEGSCEEVISHKLVICVGVVVVQLYII